MADPAPTRADRILGGYALMPRVLFESELWVTSSHLCRCLWVYLFATANYKDRGKIKRGQLFTTLADLCDALKYRAGYRTEKPQKGAVWKGLRKLREGNAIGTMKSTRGMVITIVNYERYQNPRNYEVNNERTTKATRREREGLHDTEEGKKEEGKKNTATAPVPVADDDSRFGGAWKPKGTTAQIRQAADHLRDLYDKAAGGYPAIATVEYGEFAHWAEILLGKCQNPIAGLTYVLGYQSSDVANGARWAKEHGHLFGVGHVWTAYRKRQQGVMKNQEVENKRDMAQDKRDTAAMSPELQALAGNVGTLSEEQQRDLAWANLTGPEQTKLIRVVQAELAEGSPQWQTAENEAKKRWGRDQKGN